MAQCGVQQPEHAFDGAVCQAGGLHFRDELADCGRSDLGQPEMAETGDQMEVDLAQISLIGRFLDAAEQFAFKPAMQPLAQQRCAARGIPVDRLQELRFFPKQRIAHFGVLIPVNVTEPGFPGGVLSDYIAAF